MLDDERVARLGERGWLVLDGVLGPDRALEAQAQAQALRLNGALRPAGVGHRFRHLLDRRVRSDLTCWLEADACEGALLGVLALFERLRIEVNALAFLGLVGASTQLSCHPGAGAAYLRHRDSFHDGASARRLTAVYYLNAGWSPEQGGCLRVHDEAGGPPVDVEPLLDRLLLMLAERVEHEVLPAWADRWAVSAFFHGPQRLPGT